MADMATLVDTVAVAQVRSPTNTSLTCLDILLTAAFSRSDWVRLSSNSIIAPRQIQKLGLDPGNLDRAAHLLDEGVVVEKTDWISIPATSTVAEAREWILEMRKGERGRTFLKRGTVLGIVDAERVVSGVVEIEDVIEEEEFGP